MEGFNVRAASVADLEFVSQDRYTAQIPRKRLEHKLAAGDVLVAEKQVVASQQRQHGRSEAEENRAKLAAYLYLDFLWSKIPFIAMIFVHPEHRQQGAGRALLNAVEAQLLEQGHLWLYSSSEVNQPAPQEWHRHMGFEECGIINGINGGEIGEIFFRKKLKQG